MTTPHKILIVTPHLSTGGLPQYLCAQVEDMLKHGADVCVVEYAFLSPEYVVQRNRIQSMLPKDRFVSLNGNKSDLIKAIETFNPDVLHFEEIPEMFMDRNLANEIYSRPQRGYDIVETTHTCGFNPDQKTFLPDKFVFVSPFSVKQYAKLQVPSAVVEYPVVKHQRGLSDLGLNGGMKHVLNVGLFTPGKNQMEAFDMAKRLQGNPIHFHFVGNRAPNFEGYWGKLETPTNCKLWGERNDVDRFYNAADLFLFTSLFELNPLVVKEALGWGLPVLLYDLPTYCGMYSDNPQVRFLKGDDIEHNCNILLETLNGQPTQN